MGLSCRKTHWFHGKYTVFFGVFFSDLMVGSWIVWGNEILGKIPWKSLESFVQTFLHHEDNLGDKLRHKRDGETSIGYHMIQYDIIGLSSWDASPTCNLKIMSFWGRFRIFQEQWVSSTVPMALSQNIAYTCVYGALHSQKRSVNLRNPTKHIVLV